MYRIQINEKNYEQKALKVTVFVLQYDIDKQTHYPLPDDSAFFLDFLLHYYVKEDSYIRKLTANYQPYSIAFLSHYARQFIGEVRQTDVRNAPFQKWLKKYHRKHIAEKENAALLQADYTIMLNDTLYMEHVYEGFSYNIPCRNIPTYSISEEYHNSFPNLAQRIETIIPSFKANDRVVQVKIASDNQHTFFTSESNKIKTIEHSTWNTLWEAEVEDGYTKLFEDAKQNTIGLIDFDEVVHAFDIHTGEEINYTEKVDYFLSNELNLMAHLEEHTPLAIRDKYDNLVLSVPEKKHFQTLAFSKDEKLLAIAYDAEIDIWDIKDKCLVKSIFLGKGIWQKLIFSPDNKVIFGLVGNTAIYGLTLETENISFGYQTTKDNFSIQDFDITAQYFAILEVNKEEAKPTYKDHSCSIYPMGISPVQFDAVQLHKLQKKAEERREEENRWAKFLLTIEEGKSTQYEITELKKNLYNYSAWINLGVDLEYKKLYEAEIECLKIAAQLAPHSNTINYNLGTVYMKMKAYSTAAHYLELSIKLNPKYTNAHINLSMVYFKSKELDKCQAACLNAIKTRDIAECYLNLGHAYYVQNKMQEAKDIYLKGLKKYKSSKAFIEDMLSDYNAVALYNIAENIWSDFVHSLIEK